MNVPHRSLCNDNACVGSPDGSSEIWVVGLRFRFCAWIMEEEATGSRASTARIRASSSSILVSKGVLDSDDVKPVGNGGTCVAGLVYRGSSTGRDDDDGSVLELLGRAVGCVPAREHSVPRTRHLMGLLADVSCSVWRVRTDDTLRTVSGDLEQKEQEGHTMF